MRVGFVGLGDQGGGIARRMLEQGVEMTLYARRPATLAPFRGSSARVAGSLVELGRDGDVVCVCVFDDEQVKQVLLGEGGALAGMRPGSAVVVHSTADPETVLEVERAAAARRVDVLDAPVSGGARAAEAGCLAVMVGGEAHVFERCLPLLRTFGDPVRHLGPLGSGQLAKLINNVLFAANTGLVRRARHAAEALGIDAEALTEVLRGCSSRSFAMECYRGVQPRTGVLLGKDVRLVTDVARRAAVDLGSLLAAAADALADPRLEPGQSS